MKATLESLHKAGVNFSVFDNVRIEPTDARYDLLYNIKFIFLCIKRRSLASPIEVGISNLKLALCGG